MSKTAKMICLICTSVLLGITGAVILFNVNDEDSGVFFYPFEDISRSDIESCSAQTSLWVKKELSDEQTDELVSIIHEIKLMNGNERPNDLVGNNGFFEIKMKSGNTVKINASGGPKNEMLLENGYIYKTADGRNDELYKLHQRCLKNK